MLLTFDSHHLDIVICLGRTTSMMQPVSVSRDRHVFEPVWVGPIMLPVFFVNLCNMVLTHNMLYVLYGLSLTPGAFYVEIIVCEHV